jgi:ribosomal protein L11 methyltransferase
MDWLELSVAVDREAVEAVAAIFHAHGHGGVAIEEPIQTWSDPDRYAIVEGAPVWVRTYLPSEPDPAPACEQIERALWHLGQLRPVSALQVRRVAEEDWANAWKAHFPVYHVGTRIVIKPSWLDYTARPGEVIVELDPGMAFGTGQHPTTQLMLLALEQHLQPGQTVLDLGTGSGILAIAAARLGAAHVLALDTDPVAVAAARENVFRNRLEAVIAVRQGSLDVSGRTTDHDREQVQVDLVLANIIASVIRDLAPGLARALRPGGTLIASGIIAERLDEVIAALRRAGATSIEPAVDGDWYALTVRFAVSFATAPSQESPT